MTVQPYLSEAKLNISQIACQRTFTLEDTKRRWPNGDQTSGLKLENVLFRQDNDCNAGGRN